MSAPRQNTDNRSRPQGQPPISEQGIPNTSCKQWSDGQTKAIHKASSHTHRTPITYSKQALFQKTSSLQNLA